MTERLDKNAIEIVDASLHICMGTYLQDPLVQRTREPFARERTFIWTVLCTCFSCVARTSVAGKRGGTDLLGPCLKNIGSRIPQQEGLPFPRGTGTDRYFLFRERYAGNSSLPARRPNRARLIPCLGLFGVDSPSSRMQDNGSRNKDLGCFMDRGLLLVKSVVNLYSEKRFPRIIYKVVRES